MNEVLKDILIFKIVPFLTCEDTVHLSQCSQRLRWCLLEIVTMIKVQKVHKKWTERYLKQQKDDLRWWCFVLDKKIPLKFDRQKMELHHCLTRYPYIHFYSCAVCNEILRFGEKFDSIIDHFHRIFCLRCVRSAEYSVLQN